MTSAVAALWLIATGLATGFAITATTHHQPFAAAGWASAALAGLTAALTHHDTRGTP